MTALNMAFNYMSMIVSFRKNMHIGAHMGSMLEHHTSHTAKIRSNGFQKLCELLQSLPLHLLQIIDNSPQAGINLQPQ